jgi:hypothetical protein
MAWTTLADALKSAIAQGQIAAETGVGAPDPAILAKSKRTPTEAGAKYQESLTGKPVESLPANEGHANRRMATASKAGRPIPAVAIRLVVDNGGRTEAGGDTSVRPIARAPRERRAILRLVVG